MEEQEVGRRSYEDWSMIQFLSQRLRLLQIRRILREHLRVEDKTTPE